MTVYVVNEIHLYPEVDGMGETLGVFSSEEKAKEAIERFRPDVEYYLGTGAERAYKLVIKEFEMDLA